MYAEARVGLGDYRGPREHEKYSQLVRHGYRDRVKIIPPTHGRPRQLTRPAMILGVYRKQMLILKRSILHLPIGVLKDD